MHAAVTVTDYGQPCNVWAEPACGNYARWTIERRNPDNVVTAVHHACPDHLVDGIANALGMTGSQRYMARTGDRFRTPQPPNPRPHANFRPCF